MSDLSDLEAEAAESRARLSDTIGRIQDKLTVSGMVDDFIGQAAGPRLVGTGHGFVAGLLKRHPVPLMIAAAGIGFLIHRMNRRSATGLSDVEIDVPALNTGQTRVYDPDLPTRHPLADGADPKRIEA